MTAAILTTIPMRVRGIVLNFVGIERGHRVTDATPLDALPLDSHIRIGLAVELEEVFEIEVSDDDAAAWTTIADLIRTVTRMKGLTA